MTDLVAVPLPDGRWLVLEPAALRDALARGTVLGLGANSASAQATTAGQPPERWLDSRQLAELTGVHDTTLEGWAKAGAIPSLRAGKALRFKLSEVEAAIRARTANGTGALYLKNQRNRNDE